MEFIKYKKISKILNSVVLFLLKIFHRNNIYKEKYSIPEFIKKYKIHEMNEDDMKDKLLEIISSQTGKSWYAIKDKEIAKLLIENQIQNKEKI